MQEMSTDLPDVWGDQTGGDPRYEQAGPMATRLLLGARLKRLRESAGVSREDAGFAIRGSESTISRMELGRVPFQPRDVSDLLDLYGAGQDERETVLAMAEHANAVGWWQDYSDVLPSWFTPYLGLEQAATMIRGYEVQFIPGLLQTPDYARAVLSIGGGEAAGLVTERRVSLRMRRQQLLHRPCPPRLWTVIDEAALRRPIGGAPVARAQLHHLIESARLSHIIIQIAPSARGNRAIADGAITMLRFAEASLADMVYLEQLTSAIYLNKPNDRLYYWNVLNRLATDAAPPDETEAILQRILREI
jgi:transcriptional regulator with XRE-family HTH domain